MHGQFFTASHIRVYVKAIGAIAIAMYAFTTPHLQFDPSWFLCALLVSVGTPLVYVWVKTILELRAASRDSRHRSPSITHAVPISRIHHPAERWLAGAEDGVFLCPLVFIGISPLAAFLATALYTAYQWNDQPRGFTFATSVAYFVMAVWILPQGFLMVVLAHAAAAFAVHHWFPKWFETDARIAAEHQES